jgi:hypothetical protein
MTSTDRDRWRKCSSGAEKRRKGIVNKHSKCEWFIDGDPHDINGVDLFSKFEVLWKSVPEDMDTALQALKYVESLDGSFLNTEITYRIKLTVPVMVVSEERSFQS